MWTPCGRGSPGDCELRASAARADGPETPGQTDAAEPGKRRSGRRRPRPSLSLDTQPPRAGSSGSQAPLRGPGPRLPGSAATGESPRGLGHLRGRTRSPGRSGFPAAGCRWPRRSGARLPRAPAGALRLRGARGRGAVPRAGVSVGRGGTRAREPRATVASGRWAGGGGDVHSRASVPGGGRLFPGIRGLTGEWKRKLRGLHGLREPVRGAERERRPHALSARPRGAHQWAPALAVGSRRGLGTGVDACPGPTGTFSPSHPSQVM